MLLVPPLNALQSLEHAITPTAIEHADHRAGCGRELATDLEHEERIRIVLGVESQCSRQLGRRREEIDTGSERASPQILPGQIAGERQTVKEIVRSEHCATHTRQAPTGGGVGGPALKLRRRRAEEHWSRSEVAWCALRAGIGRLRAG